MGYAFYTGTLWFLCYLLSFFESFFFFLFWDVLWKMERYWWDKYQSGNEQITSALSLETKHGLFGCQANLKMLSAVAEVHEKRRKLFPRVLAILNCSNPDVPEGVSVRGGAYVVLLHRRNTWENVCIFLMVYICKVTPSFSWWLLCRRWSCTAQMPLQKTEQPSSRWPLRAEQLLCCRCGRQRAGAGRAVSSQRRFSGISA